MNRRERKSMEKKLGIDKYKKSMPRAQRFENIRQNILEGKKMQEKMKEVVRLQENQKKDEADSQKIASIATDLMFNKGMDYVSAQEEAKKIYQKELESTKG